MRYFPYQAVAHMAPISGFSVQITIFLLPRDTIGLTRNAKHIIRMSANRKSNKPILLWVDMLAGIGIN